MIKGMSLVVALIVLAVVPTHADVWKVDPAHSSVQFKVQHLVITNVVGEFGQFDATLNFDGKDVSTGSVEMTVKSASINTGTADRDKHLKSPDFFDAEKYPDLTFKSRKVIMGEGQKFKLVGDLTMRGVTKEVTFDCEFHGSAVMMGATRAGFSATAKVNRQDYGISWSKTLDNGGLIAGNEVDITLELEFVKT